MSDLREKIRQALLELVARRDPTVFQDAEVFANKLKEIGNWPDMPEISALKAGLIERFPWELQKDPDKVVSPSNTELLARSLIKKHSFDEDEAYWAVETWGIALGLKIELPAHRIEKQEAQEAPPPPTQSPNAEPDIENSRQQKSQPVSEPDTSATRLGVIFAVDESGLTRVYKSWFGDAPRQESQGLTASTVKIERKAVAPLFSAAPKKENKDSKDKKSSTAETTKPEPGAPKLVKKTNDRQMNRVEKIKTAVKAQAQQETNIGDKFLAQANTMLPGGNGRLNIKEALKLLQKAVKMGSLNARRRFGEIYLRGIGVKANLPNAASWFKTAAKLGDAESQFQLGSLFQCGIGVNQDISQAQNWLQQAADQGHKEAKKLLEQILNP
jgi:hypothetical protein